MTTATRKDFKVNHRPILVSSRIRLSNQERAEILTAYKYAKEDNECEYVQFELTDYLEMSEPIFFDIVNNRDSVPVHILISIQKTLGVEIINRKRMIDTCTSYIDYLFKTPITKEIK